MRFRYDPILFSQCQNFLEFVTFRSSSERNREREGDKGEMKIAEAITWKKNDFARRYERKIVKWYVFHVGRITLTIYSIPSKGRNVARNWIEHVIRNEIFGSFSSIDVGRTFKTFFREEEKHRKRERERYERDSLRLLSESDIGETAGTALSKND